MQDDDEQLARALAASMQDVDPQTTLSPAQTFNSKKANADHDASRSRSNERSSTHSTPSQLRSKPSLQTGGCLPNAAVLGLTSRKGDVTAGSGSGPCL
jgi:hypothetical protein